MKKVLTALLAMGLSISAFAADIVPMNQQSNPTDSKYAGSKTCMIGVSTGTSAVECATGSGIILQVIPSTTTTDILVFRDSNTANTSSAILGQIDTTAARTIYLYPRFYNGLSVNGLTVNGTFTVIYTQPK